MKFRHKKAHDWRKGANTATNSFGFIISFEDDPRNHFFQEEETAPPQAALAAWYKKELQNLVDQNTAKINAAYRS